MAAIESSTRVIDLTVGQLLELIAPERPAPARQPERRYVYGLAGIAQLFNCSVATANRIKKSGAIDKAIRQHGRVIVVDADMALDLFSKR